MTDALDPLDRAPSIRAGEHESEAFLDELVAIFADFVIGQEEILRHAKRLDRFEARVTSAAERSLEAYRLAIGEHLGAPESHVPQDQYQQAFNAVFDTLDEDKELRPEERTAALRRTMSEIDALEADRAGSDKRSRKQFVQAEARRRDGGVVASQLVNMVGELELFISRFVTRWFQRDLSHLGEKKITLTLSQMREIDSVDDVIEETVTEFIDELMNSGSGSWFSTLEKMLDARVEGADEFAFLESIQRRHVIVHHGGLASRRYLRALNKFPLSVELDSQLPVDLRYLVTAGDAMAAVAHSIVVCGLLKSGEPSKEIESAIAELTFFLLQRERFRLVERFGERFNLARVKDEFAREQLRVNVWIARSELHGVDAIRSEVEAWDVEAKSDLFKLARLTLTDRFAEAVPLAKQLIASDVLETRSIFTWPLFGKLRHHFFADDEPVSNPGRDVVE